MSSSDYDQRTALHVAAAEGHSEIVRFLVNIARVKIDPKDRYVNKNDFFKKLVKISPY